MGPTPPVTRHLITTAEEKILKTTLCTHTHHQITICLSIYLSGPQHSASSKRPLISRQDGGGGGGGGTEAKDNREAECEDVEMEEDRRPSLQSTVALRAQSAACGSRKDRNKFKHVNHNTCQEKQEVEVQLRCDLTRRLI